MVSLNQVSTVMIFAGMPALIMFVLTYAIKSPWQSTAAGRAIMQLAVSLTSIYILAGANGLFGVDWPFRGVVRFMIYTCVTISLWRLFLTLRRIQRGADIPLASPPEDTRGIAQEDPKLDQHMADLGSKPNRYATTARSVAEAKLKKKGQH